jgi:hypothetical protein
MTARLPRYDLVVRGVHGEVFRPKSLERGDVALKCGHAFLVIARTHRLFVRCRLRLCTEGQQGRKHCSFHLHMTSKEGRGPRCDEMSSPKIQRLVSGGLCGPWRSVLGPRLAGGPAAGPRRNSSRPASNRNRLEHLRIESPRIDRRDPTRRNNTCLRPRPSFYASSASPRVPRPSPRLRRKCRHNTQPGPPG